MCSVIYIQQIAWEISTVCFSNFSLQDHLIDSFIEQASWLSLISHFYGIGGKKADLLPDGKRLPVPMGIRNTEASQVRFRSLPS